jgi:NAD(P)-dependent dehydrogenase (short-subunit alcohol dehydrogenase family)
VADTALVTGGAGFIGSHLAGGAARGGLRGLLLRRRFDRFGSEEVHAAIGWQPTMGLDGILADVIAHAEIARDSALSTA